VRHAVRPYSTVLLFAKGTRLPFDLALDRGLPYSLTEAGSAFYERSKAVLVEADAMRRSAVRRSVLR